MSDRWKDLYAKLEIRAGAKARKPTDAMLDRFEKAHGFELPDDYRGFAKTFGPGELGAYVRIYTPVPKGSNGDLSELVDMVHEGAEVLSETYGDPKLIERLVPFADTIGGDTIAWDPEAVTDADAHEYAILLLPDDSPKVKRVASDFGEFVDICLSTRLGKFIGAKDYEPVESFVPFAAMEP